jgi:hypothetical protein
MDHNTANRTGQEHAELGRIATNAVKWHTKHLEACDRKPLVYIDELLDALMADRSCITLHELASDLLVMVPYLTECQALGLVRLKFVELGQGEYIG